MLASIVNFFNPSLIVIGGGLSHSGDQLLAAVREAVYRRSLPLATRELLIQRSSLGGLAGVIGASAMVVDQLFASRLHRDAGSPRAVPPPRCPPSPGRASRGRGIGLIPAKRNYRRDPGRQPPGRPNKLA